MHEPTFDGQASESEFHLSEYLELLRRHWKLIAVTTVLGALVGVLHYATTPKVFRATTRIQIERRSPSPLGNQYAWVYEAWNPQFYPTQYKLLQSRLLAEKVVLALELWQDPRFAGGTVTLASRGVAGEVTSEDDRRTLARLAQKLKGGLEIRPVRDTQLVDIVYRSRDPHFASRVANAYAVEFRELGIDTRIETVNRASGFLEVQIGELRAEIESRERELHNARREIDIVALDPTSNVTLQRLESVNGEYMKARSQRIQKEVRYKELVTAPVESIADARSDSLVRQLRQRQIRLEQEYADKLQVYKSEWPAMLELRTQIEKIGEDLKASEEEVARKVRGQARGDFQTALRAEEALKQELDEMKTEIIDHNVEALEYSNTQVEISTRRQLLDELMRKQSETGVALQESRESTVRLIEEALVPGAPYQPNLRKDASTGIGIGLLIGVGLVLLLEFMDRSIKSGEELERRLGLPTLAVISDISESRGRHRYMAGYGYGYGRQRSAQPPKRPKRVSNPEDPTTTIELLPQTRPRLAVSEAYRSLRTALLLSSAEELKVLVITSATAGEGKTATATNLATVMAQLGRRVLLLDADLRKPRLHQIFKVSNRVGVVGYLVGDSPADQIFCYNGIPNLAVAPSGPIPPNPSELLSSTRMRDFIQHARSRFDFIIIDTPPALAVTDSTLMGDVADGLVLCVQAGRTSRGDVKACRDRLRLAGVKILGTVLNRYRPLSGRYGKGYYYRHYEAYGEYIQEAQGDSQT